MQARLLTPLLLLLLLACACARVAPDPSSGEPSDDAGSLGSTGVAPGGDDAGAYQTPGDDASSDDAATYQPDDAPSGPPFDAGPDGICPPPLVAGDLAIDELMIASVAGAGDYGEWVEVGSTRDCALDLRGLHGECPKGDKVAVFDVLGDAWLPARGTFLVADSANPAVNHDLPGTLFVWSGIKGDILRNKGGTVNLLLSGGLIDSVTYPALKLDIGASVAFPADCHAAKRSDFASWQTSTSSWFPGFLGTPNAPNSDVHCL